MEKLIKLDRDVIKNAVLDSNKTAFSSTYQSKGVTYRSNDPAVVQRDEAGNVILLEGEQNQLLRIEPIATNITTTSMLKVLDTQFTYFKFPTSYPIETTLDLDLDLDIELDTVDTVYARYKPSIDLKLGYTNETGPSGILMDDVVEGSSQTNINKYYITKEIKDSGVDLRFRGKINHKFQSTWYSPEQIAAGLQFASLSGRPLTDFLPGYKPKSNVWFFISKEGPNTPLNREFVGAFGGFSVNPLYADEWGSIAKYEVRDTLFDVVIPNEQFEAGDYFGITQHNTEASFDDNDPDYNIVFAEQSYWVITDASKNVDLWNREI
jgi:hypothetical protein